MLTIQRETFSSCLRMWVIDKNVNCVVCDDFVCGVRFFKPTSFVRSVAAILLKHKLSLVEEGFQMIKVVRNASLLNQVLDIYHDNSFSLHKHPTVYFENEEGYDAGGLTRDF